MYVLDGYYKDCNAGFTIAKHTHLAYLLHPNFLKL